MGSSATNAGRPAIGVITDAAFINGSGSPVQDADHAGIGGTLPMPATSRSPTHRE
jgi:hypothetical protein